MLPVSISLSLLFFTLSQHLLHTIVCLRFCEQWKRAFFLCYSRSPDYTASYYIKSTTEHIPTQKSATYTIDSTTFRFRIQLQLFWVLFHFLAANFCHSACCLLPISLPSLLFSWLPLVSTLFLFFCFFSSLLFFFCSHPSLFHSFVLFLFLLQFSYLFTYFAPSDKELQTHIISSPPKTRITIRKKGGFIVCNPNLPLSFAPFFLCTHHSSNSINFIQKSFTLIQSPSLQHSIANHPIQYNPIQQQLTTKLTKTGYTPFQQKFT